ncbi:hypothetical protein LL050_002906, partial [Providencia rettgeri]|nr:hypothetical protein [Providencia rettgeri]
MNNKNDDSDKRIKSIKKIFIWIFITLASISIIKVSLGDTVATILQIPLFLLLIVGIISFINDQKKTDTTTKTTFTNNTNDDNSTLPINLLSNEIKNKVLAELQSEYAEKKIEEIVRDIKNNLTLDDTKNQIIH